MVNSCCCFFLLTACPHRQGNNATLTLATWITSPNSTTLHFNQLFRSLCLVVHCDLTRSLVLPGSFMRTFSILLTCAQLGSSGRCCVRVSVELEGPERCRLAFTPGERWELWEQSVLVCWRRPACSVLHAWVWTKGYAREVGVRTRIFRS